MRMYTQEVQKRRQAVTSVKRGDVAMKSFTRRAVLENCIVRGGIVAGVPMSANQLLALWQDGERSARKPTPSEVLGPVFNTGAPNTAVPRPAGEHPFALHAPGVICNT